MRIFCRTIATRSGVTAGTRESITYPPIPGHVLGVAFQVTGTISNGGAAPGTYTVRDLLRTVSVSQQDRAGQREVEGLTLEDIGILSEASGHALFSESIGGDLEDGQAVTIAAGATHSWSLRVILPYADMRKTGSQRYDLARECVEALQSLYLSVDQARGSAADITTGAVDLAIRVVWTPDLSGHVGLRRQVVPVEAGASATYDFDFGDARYAVAYILSIAPYVAGAAPDLSGFGRLSLYEGSEPRMVSEDIREGDLAAYGFGANPAPALRARLALNCALEVFAPTLGYSNADLLGGHLRAEWSTALAHRDLVVRLWGVDRSELVSRYPHLSPLSAADIARVTKPLAQPGRIVSVRTQLMTPAKLIAPADKVISVLKAGEGR